METRETKKATTNALFYTLLTVLYPESRGMLQSCWIPLCAVICVTVDGSGALWLHLESKDYRALIALRKDSAL
jgi:hypothetical protein